MGVRVHFSGFLDPMGSMQASNRLRSVERE
jgi:hypothetical protein